jgi:uncharacterized protein (TIGR03067 family)
MTANVLRTLGAVLALAALAADARKDEDALQGQWKATSVVTNGKPSEAKEIANVKLVVAGDKMTALDGNDALAEYTFRLDPAARPRAIDFAVQSGADKGKVVLGVYKIEGDTLAVCVAEPGKKERPKEFRSPEGSSFIHLVFQRIKP